MLGHKSIKVAHEIDSFKIDTFILLIQPYNQSHL